jgi:hypothetical protein
MKEAALELRINPGGRIRCVYGEEIDLGQLGRLSISRGSHVEPTTDGRWTADLSPVNGPRLGPYSSRSDQGFCTARYSALALVDA